MTEPDTPLPVFTEMGFSGRFCFICGAPGWCAHREIAAVVAEAGRISDSFKALQDQTSGRGKLAAVCDKRSGEEQPEERKP